MKTLNIIILILIATVSFGQTKVDQERMDRDIEVAENALATMIKQKMGKRQMYMDIKANYTPGYGITMRVPNENTSWFSYDRSVTGRVAYSQGGPAVGVGTHVVVVGDDDLSAGQSATVQSIKANSPNAKEKDKERTKEKAPVAFKSKEEQRDSALAVYYGALVESAKDFIVDYGDLLTQLQPDEKIMVTNRGEGGRYYYDFNKPQRRKLITIEGTKADLVAYRQGKLTRDQVMSKVKVVNTESTGDTETDLELLSSIIGRLYRSDLSKTFYTEENIYYERLKDFGVIYYMTAYSSSEQSRFAGDRSQVETKGKIWSMPTQRLEGLTQEQRDKKVVELYPQFEKELKENIVEYAQTVKSLKDDEMFVFNVTLTKCVGCNIPTNLELSVKNAMVRKLAAGQASKSDVVNAINVKKGPNQ